MSFVMAMAGGDGLSVIVFASDQGTATERRDDLLSFRQRGIPAQAVRCAARGGRASWEDSAGLFCHQRRCERGAQRQNHFSIGVGVEAVEETYREGADRREKRVGGTRVYSLGFIGEKGHEAGSVFSDPGAALADRAVF